MKLRELISKTTKSMAVLSLFVFTTSNCKAAETINYYSAVKDNILQAKTYDEFYDVNDDGVVNVFDAIRINQNECHEDLKKELSDLKKEFTELKSDINNVSERVDTNATNIAKESDIVNLFYGESLPLFRKSIAEGNATVIFVGDSWTAGQGATETGANEAIGMVTPGRTDGFHVPDSSSGKFVDKISRALTNYYPLSMTDGYIRADSTSMRTYTGTWSYDSSSSVPASEAGERAYAYSSAVGDRAIIKAASNHIKMRVLKSSYGGSATIRARVNSGSDIITDSGMNELWKPLSQIKGVTRLDSYSDIDKLDLYLPINDYTGYLDIVMPYGKSWEIELTVTDKNPKSNGNIVTCGCSYYENAFYNAGRGNHTTADYVGVKVGAGAGQPGSTPYGDNTDHLAEVIALNPTLIIFEPMIINDWFYGLNRAHSGEFIESMITRLKAYGKCDIIALMPGPVVTTSDSWDYESTTEPPLNSNLHGKGTYKDYYNNAIWILKKHQIKTINTYQYFVDEYNSPNHINWTTGSQAGRIHVNQHGHDMIYQAFINESGLADLLV